MSAVLPDPTPDLATAAHREVMAIAETLELLGLHEADTEWNAPWIFKGEPKRNVKGSGKASVCVSSPRPWAGATRGHTNRFPIIQIEVFSDLARTSAGGPVFRDAESQAEDIWLAIDPIFNRVGGGGFEWGNDDGRIFVTSSYRASGDREIGPVPDSDGVVRLLCSYNVEL